MHGKTLHFESHSTTDTAKYMISDFAGDTNNPNDVPFATANTVLSMWGKGNGEAGAPLLALDASFFFAYPYASWQRGTNENTNGLIRQSFSRAATFKRLDRATSNGSWRNLTTACVNHLNSKLPMKYSSASNPTLQFNVEFRKPYNHCSAAQGLPGWVKHGDFR